MIYLDNASTTWPKPETVTRETQRFLAEDAANPGRGGHRMSLRAGRLVEEVRSRLTRFIDGEDHRRLIFTLNCTDALNMAIKGCLKQGDHVITTVLEHNSVLRPLRGLADARVIEMDCVPMSGEGFIDPQAVAAAWRPNTRLVALNHASNVLGTLQPIEEVGRLVRQRGGLFLVDAAQSIGVVDISVRRMNIDLLAFSGHKELLAPMGTGGLYVSPRVSMRPWREGGTGGDSLSARHPEEWPTFLEAGTANAVGIAGLGAGLDFVQRRGSGALLAHARRLVQRLADQLRDDPRFVVHGPAGGDGRVGVLSLSVVEMESEEVAAVLDESFDIAVRAGLHCAPLVHQALGTAPGGTVRVSVGPFNTLEDIDAVVGALRRMAT